MKFTNFLCYPNFCRTKIFSFGIGSVSFGHKCVLWPQPKDVRTQADRCKKKCDETDCIQTSTSGAKRKAKLIESFFRAYSGI